MEILKGTVSSVALFTAVMGTLAVAGGPDTAEAQSANQDSEVVVLAQATGLQELVEEGEGPVQQFTELQDEFSLQLNEQTQALSDALNGIMNSDPMNRDAIIENLDAAGVVALGILDQTADGGAIDQAMRKTRGDFDAMLKQWAEDPDFTPSQRRTLTEGLIEKQEAFEGFYREIVTLRGEVDIKAKQIMDDRKFYIALKQLEDVDAILLHVEQAIESLRELNSLFDQYSGASAA